MRCQSSHNIQAVCIGGTNPEDISNPWDSVDEWKQGIGVFDMKNLVLKDRYEANAPPYIASELVRRAYSEPVSVIWTSHKVKEIFDHFYSPKTTAWRLPQPTKTMLRVGFNFPTIIFVNLLGLILLCMLRTKLQIRKYKPIDCSLYMKSRQLEKSDKMIESNELTLYRLHWTCVSSIFRTAISFSN
jgi:hypothetical protein